jgi:hypothetical protein
VTFSDEAKTEIHGIVDQLAIAKKKLANAEEESAKVPGFQATVDHLKSKLMIILDKAGFTEEAIELLLAAR